MAEKQEAEETGEDLERKRNWAYSIVDSDAWEKKQDRKKRRADQGFTGTSPHYLVHLRRFRK